MSPAKSFVLVAGTMAVLLVSSASLADGVVVDKIYDPYVNPLEKEIEYRMVDSEDENGRHISLHQLGMSWSPINRLSLEVYGKVADPGGRQTLDGWELEARYQLTEQGEYAIDWGVMAEYERETESDNEELSTSLLAQSSWQRWIGLANFSLAYESLTNAKDEWETTMSVQTRYRYHPHLEPGLEFHAGEDYRGIGPVVMGTIRFPGARSLHWELGSVFGLDSDSADATLRLVLEYEFY